MLFNSYIFIFAFLPAVAVLWHIARRYVAASAALGVLFLSSILYYGWWNPVMLWLIAALAGFTYLSGLAIEAMRMRGRQAMAKSILAGSLIALLAVLAWYKYSVFIAETMGLVEAGMLQRVTLPLGISFFTFQKIAYLSDIARGEKAERSLLRFSLFVTFFPQLIAGPIVHPRELLPQFRATHPRGLLASNVAIGLSIFSIGLFKKVCIADSLATFVSPIFAQAEHVSQIDFLTAWSAALGYTFQIYFDFSGYCDMAVGAARLFGIRLPINFDAPYRASSPIDFWRRWHITLSRFLRDYVYIPMGGNRHGRQRRYLNLMATMLIGGLWHGAGWTFILWGAIHGALLAVNHAMRDLWPGREARQGVRYALCCCGTFVAVCFAWVVFRADTLHAAMAVWKGMLALGGFVVPASLAGLGSIPGVTLSDTMAASDLLLRFTMLAACFCIVWLLPTAYELTRRYRVVSYESRHYRMPFRPQTTLGRLLRWKPTMLWAGAMALLFVIAVIRLAAGQSEFLYYDF